MPCRHIHAFARWQYTQSGLETICTLIGQPPCDFHQCIAAAPMTTDPIATAAMRGVTTAPEGPYARAGCTLICRIWHAGHHHEVSPTRGIAPEAARAGFMPARIRHAGHHHEGFSIRAMRPDGALLLIFIAAPDDS